eukprot:TRINITY_DN1945_c0_g1_i3.p1 TRINITY_DN1945_c0_g1~~TRINITY_DN1945_c0_g1_i3.p1  ORF type:complete len:303 (-),score=37.46 TRINITY_DN1945_c0_g1_i3:136-1044(-)
MQAEFPSSFVFPVSLTSLSESKFWNTDTNYLRELRGNMSSVSSKEDMQALEHSRNSSFDLPLAFLLNNPVSLSTISTREKPSVQTIQDQKRSSSQESEDSHARCSAQVSQSSSPKVVPLTGKELLHGGKARRKGEGRRRRDFGLGILRKFKNLKTEWETKMKDCIELLVRAVEEDLGRSAKRCANIYCEMIQQFGAKIETNERDIRGRKEWLCDGCAQAYDHGQFCEFCWQIYLDAANESAALDGEEWAQCEASGCCERWVHVGCLAERLRKPRETIVEEKFRYVCGRCEGKIAGKRSSCKR